MKNELNVLNYVVFPIFTLFFITACGGGSNNQTPTAALANQLSQPCPATGNPALSQAGCVQQVTNTVSLAPGIKAEAAAGQTATVVPTGSTAAPSNPAAVQGMGPMSVDTPATTQDRTSISGASMATASVDSSPSQVALAAAQPSSLYQGVESEGVALPSYDSPNSDLRRPSSMEAAPAPEASGSEAAPPSGGTIR